MLRALPPQSIVPPAPFYSPVSDDEAEEADEPMVASGIGPGAAAGSFLHYNEEDLVNGRRFC